MSPDGTRVAAADASGAVVEVEVWTGAVRLARQLAPAANGAGVSLLTYQGGALLALEWDAGALRVHDLSSGRSIAEVPVRGTPTSARTTPYGAFAVADDVAGTTVLRLAGSPPTEVEPRALLPEATVPLCLAAGGSLLVGHVQPGGRGRAPPELLVWDVPSGRVVARLPPGDAVCAPEGDQVAVRGDGDVEVFRVGPTGSEGLFRVGVANVSQVEFDSGELLVWTHEGTSTHLDAATGEVRSARRIPVGHRWIAAAAPWHVSRFGESWSLWPQRARSSVVTRVPGSLDALAISGDGVLLAFAGEGPELWIVDAETGRLVRSLPADPRGTRALRFSADGSALLACGRSGEVDVYSLVDGVAGQALPELGPAVTPMSAVWVGRRPLVAYSDGHLVEWELEPEPHAVRTFRGSQGFVWDVELSPDGRTLLTTGRDAEDPQAALFDVATGAETWTSPLSTVAYDAAFAPDGRFVVGNHAGAPWVGSVRGERPLVLPALEEVAYVVGFTADGELALTGTYDGRLVFWDLATAAAAQSFRIARATLTGLVADPRGDSIYIADADGAVHRFDLHPPAPLPDREVHLVQAVAASGDLARADLFARERGITGELPPLLHARLAWAAGDPERARASMAAAVAEGRVLAAVAEAWGSAP
jgi:WD40 repeat protein